MNESQIVPNVLKAVVWCPFRLQKRLSFKCSALDTIRLHHELGRCYLELKNFSEARNHGRLSLNEAQKAQDSEWLLNAVVLMANIDSELQFGLHLWDVMLLFSLTRGVV